MIMFLLLIVLRDFFWFLDQIRRDIVSPFSFCCFYDILKTIMPFLAEFLTVALVHLLAVISPGPDFALISRNSLVYSRRTGIWSSIGLALGILVHVTYSLVGIGFIISRSVLLFSILKYLGAAYLIYIGWKSLRAGALHASAENRTREQDMAPFAALRMGFFTNVTNPKATLFFFSLFTQVINPHTPVFIQALYGIEMSAATFAWFALVAATFSQQWVRDRVAKFQHRVEQAFGVLLIALGIKVALASS